MTMLEASPEQNVPEAAPEPTDAQVAPSGTQVAQTGETATQQPQEQAPYWPEDWRDRWAGNDVKLRQHLNRFTAPDGVFKQWRSLEKQRNSGLLKPARPDTDDEATLAAWRKEVGAPEKPEGYYDHIERDASDFDKASLDRMFTRMHNLGVPADQAKEVVEEYFRMADEGRDAIYTRDAEFKRTAEDELRGEWGPEYRQNLNAIGILFEQHGSRELFDALSDARFADGRKVADDPAILKFLAGVAREMHPDGNVIISPIAGMDRSSAIGDEISRLENEMRDTKGVDPNGYWKNQAKQNRYRELIEARERMQGRGR